MEVLELPHLARVSFALQTGSWGWWLVMGADKSHKKWLPCLAACPTLWDHAHN